MGQEVPLFDLAYFDNMDEPKNDWRDHNTVLKWFRDTCEKTGLAWALFSNTEAHDVPLMLHDEKGPQYCFPDESVTFPWMWQSMIKQIRADHRQLVVQGPEDRSRGLVGCSLKQTELYDHTRHTQLRDRNGGMMYHWFFVLHREDGSVAVLKPSHKSIKIAVRWQEPAKDETTPKKGGMGGSDGPGTFRKFLNKGVDLEVAFNPARTIRRPNFPLRQNNDAGWADWDQPQPAWDQPQSRRRNNNGKQRRGGGPANAASGSNEVEANAASGSNEVQANAASGSDDVAGTN